MNRGGKSVPYQPGPDCHFVAYYQSGQELAAGKGSFGDFARRQKDRQSACTRMPFHKAKSIVEVQRVGGVTVGEGGPYGGRSPAVEDYRTILATEVSGCEAGHETRNRRLRTRYHGPHGIEKATLCLVHNPGREVRRSQTHYEVQNMIRFVHDSSFPL
jgi:hypothetical protein